jgi:hypothetical protein
MEFREKRDRATAIGEAESDVTATGDRRQRYAATSRRISHAALRMLITLKNERRKFGEGELEDVDEETSPTAEAAPAEAGAECLQPQDTAPESNHDEPAAVAAPATAATAESPQPAPAPAATGRGKNEPVTTQVVGGVSRNNAPAPRAAVAPTVPPGHDHDAFLRLVEEGMKEFAHLRQYDHLK